jgi:streptogramin lyase
LLRFDPRTENFTIVDIAASGSFPFRLVTDEAGRIWFTELLGNKIGVYDPLSNQLQEYAVPSYFAGPADLTFDNRGNLWFTEAYNESVAEFQPLTKSFVEYHLSTNDPSRFISSPVGIAMGQDGNVWFADHGGNWIAEFNPVSKALTRYPTTAPSGYSYGIAIPNGMLVDGQGKVWFSEHWGNRIGYYDPSTHTMVEFPIPTGPISTALWIAQAPAGDIWFTEWNANKIGVLHADPIVPFALALSEVNLSLAAGEETTLTISTKVTSGIVGNGTFTYSWSSYMPSEVGVTFSPNPYPSLEGQSNLGQAEVKASNKVIPGNYTLAIGIDAGEVRVSSMIHVEVTPANSVPGPVSAYPTLLVLAPFLGVAIAAWFLRKRFFRTQFGETKND